MWVVGYIHINSLPSFHVAWTKSSRTSSRSYSNCPWRQAYKKLWKYNLQLKQQSQSVTDSLTERGKMCHLADFYHDTSMDLRVATWWEVKHCSCMYYPCRLKICNFFLLMKDTFITALYVVLFNIQYVCFQCQICWKQHFLGAFHIFFFSLLAC